MLRSLLSSVGLARKPAAPAAPEGFRLYAVGDIHGQAAALERLLAVIHEDGRRAFEAAGVEPVVIFLGDYVDRGPDSRAVVERLRWAGDGDRQACPFPARFLLGNHESAMRAFLEDPLAEARWLDFGGAATAASYGVRASVGVADPHRLRDLAEALAGRVAYTHRAFLEGLEAMVVLGDYAFVHAGIRPGRRLGAQRLEDLLWIREPFLSSRRRHEKVIVHGHSVVETPQFHANRIAVDTGAYASGILSAVVLEGTWRGVLFSG